MVPNIDTLARNNASLFNAYDILMRSAGAELAEGTSARKELQSRMYNTLMDWSKATPSSLNPIESEQNPVETETQSLEEQSPNHVSHLPPVASSGSILDDDEVEILGDEL